MLPNVPLIRRTKPITLNLTDLLIKQKDRINVLIRPIMGYTLLFALVISCQLPVQAQINKDSLRRIGVVPGKTYNYRIAADSSTATIMIKMVPNVSNMGECGTAAVEQYKRLVDGVLRPIDDYLRLFKNEITIEEPPGGKRLLGAVIGTVALGVAAAAKITAGIALHNSLKNSAAIASLTQAAINSNRAIESLRTSTGLAVTMINGIQDHLNEEVLPALNDLGCGVAENKLGIALTQYYAQLDTTFGPSLQNPAMAEISIQAISSIFDGDVGRLVSTMGYSLSEIRDVMEQGMITGKITMVDLDARILIMEVEFPNLLSVDSTVVQELHSITFSNMGSEWISVVPGMVLQRGPLLSGIRYNDCKVGATTIICSQDESYALEPALSACLSGNLGSCARTRVVNSVAPRYMISEDRVLANCISTLCTCVSTGRPMIQSASVTLLDISRDACPIVSVDNVRIKPGIVVGNITFNSSDIDFGPVTTVDPLDQSVLIGLIKEKLDETDKYLAASNKLLAGINVDVVNTGSMSAVLAICIMLIISNIALAVLTIYILISLRKIRRTVNTNRLYTNSGISLRDLPSTKI
ncbi:fusion glycoprotein [Hippocampus erectus paramyxovirus 1]|nr:fusion glycoprotein [Hippocampus erectus paramyxovirus 1]